MTYRLLAHRLRLGMPLIACATIAALGPIAVAAAASPPPSLALPPAVTAVTAPVDDAIGAALDYDVPAAVHAVTDAGALDGSRVLERVQLLLKRSAARQAALDVLVAAQTDRRSPQYHHWVNPSEFGANFGPADADIERVVGWLTAHGLIVDEVAPNKMSIAFTGTVKQIEDTFKTPIHDVVGRDGAHHIANLAAPVIPKALTGVVHGVTLSGFFPRPTLREVGTVTKNLKTGQTAIVKPAPNFNVNAGSNGIYYALAPQDLATIYDITTARNGSPNIFDANGNPLSLTGAGQTVIVAEQTDIKPADWSVFRKVFGLSGYPGKLEIVHPGGCKPPGFTPDEGEAALDAEWASAAAPAATIVVASCAGTATTFGVMTTLQNLVDHGPVGSAISISYGNCEAGNGLSFQSMWTHLVEQAAAEGIAVFVSAGDGAGAGCDNFDTASYATGGLAANGLASSPYDTVAGGTDFSDGADNTYDLYWAAKNAPNYGSALGYIPEIPWDDSCASSVFVAFLGAPGPIHVCNVPKSPLLNIVGGSGGKSLYYGKPSWQTGVLGMPNDGARDLPDVSLFASNGFWGHFYVFCMSDTNQGGTACDYKNVNDVFANAAGGTSFVAPILAGLQGLVAQYASAATGEKQLTGNAAPVYYALAQAQFSESYLLGTCKSNLGLSISRACVFNEITRGNTAVPCKAGTPDCFTDAASTQGIGVLSTSKSKEEPAFNTDLGWSFATGLGSVNVTNLLINYISTVYF